MNKKHFVYSFQYLAVLLSLFTFTACEKDEFTAEDALALEEQRANMQAQLDEAAKDAELQRMMDLQKWAHTIDSLNAANAGGLVFYSVSVVPGGSTAFANGRYEEVGVNGVTVTASQYGMEQSATTNNGIAVFPEPFRSGEVTVTVDTETQGYTSAHYTSNLTPDGGVPNDATVFVNNIIPVFENDPGIHGEEDMAMISGRAWAELNLLYGNNVEEQAPAGTAFTAVIDTRPGYGFWEEYIQEANGADENGNGNVNDGTTKSGFIQMIRYENASTRAQVQADGAYDMMVAATASGLPVRMNYSEFVADREWFQAGASNNGPGPDDEDFGVVSKRTLYGPDVTPTGIGISGLFDGTQFASASISLVERDAVIEATVTSTGQVQTVSAAGMDWLVLHPNAAGTTNFNPSGTVSDGLFPAAGFGVPNTAYAPFAGTNFNSNINAGAYLADGNIAADGVVAPPTVTFSASPSGDPLDNVTGYVVLSEIDGSGVPGGTTSVTGGDNQLREIVAIAITNKGANYDVNNPVTVTIGSPNNTGVTGTGSIQAPSSSLSYARVIDGGFGFHPDDIDLQEVGQWTGFDPVINVPSTVTDYPATSALTYEYDWEREDTWGGALSGVTSVGTVQTIDFSGPQGTWNATELATLNNNPFVYYREAANVNLVDADGDEFFIISSGSLIGHSAIASGGATSWGTLAGTGDTDGSGQWNPSSTQYAFDDADIPSGTSRGQGYVFVPEVRVVGGTFNTPAEVRVFIDGYGPSTPTVGMPAGVAPGATLPITAYTGAVVGGIGELEIISGGSNYTAVPTSFQFIEPTNSLDAEFYTAGSSIDNYAVDGTGAGNIINDAVWSTLVINTGDIDPANNSYTVWFSDPSDASGVRAIGVPSFDNTIGTDDGTDSNGRTVLGVEIVDDGVGYDQSQTITWELIPTDGQQALIEAFLAPNVLTFTLVDGGLGYAVQPDVYVVGGGVNLDDPNAVNPADFMFNFDNNGTIIGMSFTDNTNGAYTAANAAIDPIVVTVTVEEQEAFFNAFMNEATDFNGSPLGFDGTVRFAGNCDAMTGIGWFAWGAFFADDVELFHDDLTATGNANGVRFMGGNLLNTFITAPTLTISNPFGGTAATAEYILDPTDGTVKDVVLTSGGTGYGCIETNDPSINTGGEPFRVLGGPDGNTVDADGDGNAEAFQVYSGLQYVRDVHYGSGEVLE